MPDDEPRLCRFCGAYATHTCPRCGKAYCDAHGRDLCQDCLAPAGALPSRPVFIGSLLTLAVAGAFGLWVLFAPPSLPGEHRLAKSSAQNPAAVQPQARKTVAGRSAVPTPLPAIAISPTPPAARSYTVVAGDTLSGIAASFDTTVAAIQAANPGVTPSRLLPGQELIIPPPGVILTPVPSATPSPSPTPSATPSPTSSPSPTASPSPSPAPSPAPTESPSPAPADTSTPAPANTSTPAPATPPPATPAP